MPYSRRLLLDLWDGIRGVPISLSRGATEQETLKKDFEMEKKAWADEKIALINRAEKAEVTLAETTAELSGLKCHVSQMVSAIFGKLLCKC